MQAATREWERERETEEARGEAAGGTQTHTRSHTLYTTYEYEHEDDDDDAGGDDGDAVCDDAERGGRAVPGTSENFNSKRKRIFFSFFLIVISFSVGVSISSEILRERGHPVADIGHGGENDVN